tara:strand:+ start:407 stop:580 length:174 start_codon:yes stop_codon:yes gene_type:complete
MTNLIVKGNQVKVSQNGRITYIYEVENTDVKSLIEGLNKQTDENSDDRLSVDDILYK